jgi:hypothetical protein
MNQLIELTGFFMFFIINVFILTYSAVTCYIYYDDNQTILGKQYNYSIIIFLVY